MIRFDDRALNEDAGKALLRISLGGMMLFHGLSKLAHGVSGISGMLTAHGLPGFLAYGVYLGEVIAPLLLIFGVATRAASAILAGNMVVAILLAHSADAFARNPRSGAWAIELQMLYLLGAVVVMLIGPGRYVVGRR